MLLSLHVCCGISLYPNNWLRFIQSINRKYPEIMYDYRRSTLSPI